MQLTRTRALIRAGLALLFAVTFALTAFTMPAGATDAGFVAPMVALLTGAVALLGLAWSAWIVAGGIESTDPALRARRARAARPGYRIAQWGVLGIPILGVASGLITWLLDKNIVYLLVMAWSTAIVWLVHLLLIRRHGPYLAALRGRASAVQSGAAEPEHGAA
jgi:hypothetical protein